MAGFMSHRKKKKRSKKSEKKFCFSQLGLAGLCIPRFVLWRRLRVCSICTPLTCACLLALRHLPSVVAGILTTYWARAVESCKEGVMLILIYRYTVSTCHGFLHSKSQTSSIYREVISASGIYSEGFSFLIKKRLRQNGRLLSPIKHKARQYTHTHTHTHNQSKGQEAEDTRDEVWQQTTEQRKARNSNNTP